jgi:hypothetical protein|tara:strand:+ start:149 stop:313 length:165 start_codon:yes stop_codon:yes gene_type:complete
MQLGAPFLLTFDQESYCISAQLQMYLPAMRVPNQDRVSFRHFGVQLLAANAQLI